MRKILFRGKTNSTNPKYAYYNEWIYGDLMSNRDKQFIHPKDNIFRIEHHLAKIVVSHEVDPKTVGQYTGLTDKNGTKIFEGDLLRFPAKNEWEETNFEAYEVFYHDNDCADRHIGWQFNRLHFLGNLKGKDIWHTSFLPKYTKQMEVIGNIHDNPELLGGDGI